MPGQSTGEARLYLSRVSAQLAFDETSISDHEVSNIQVGFELGMRYFVAAVQLDDGRLVTSACKGSREIRSQEDLENLLARAGNPTPAESATGSTTPFLVILAVVVILGVVWYLAISHDRSSRNGAM